MRRWAGVLCGAVLLALCAPAGAQVLLLSRDGTVFGLPVRDSYTELVGWTDDGTGLLVRRERQTLRLDLATGATTPQPMLDDAVSVGPGARTVVTRYRPGGVGVEVREEDGRVVGAIVVPARLLLFPTAAWSPDGTRVAVAAPPTLVVLDTLSGAQVLRATIKHAELSRQAFAPDGSSLLVADDERIVRVDLPSGHQAVVLRAPKPGIGVGAAWGAGGQVALAHDDRIRIVGSPEVRVPAFRVDDLSWTQDGALTYVAVSGSRFSCGPNRHGVGLLVPGAQPRDLIAPSGGEVSGAIWSPDGQTLAVAQGSDTTVEHRGRRHPWPRHIARQYEMFSRRGDAAVRRIVVRAARALRRGAGRAATLGGVSDDLERVAVRFDEAHDTAVEEALAHELDKWLHAAGFARIESRDEFSC